MKPVLIKGSIMTHETIQTAEAYEQTVFLGRIALTPDELDEERDAIVNTTPHTD